MLSSSEIQQEAERRAGAPDALASDFQPSLDLLVSSLNATGKLSASGVQEVRDEFATWLSNRIQLQQWLDKAPEIADEQIEAPLFLAGLPRSGTTYLQYLFDRDARYRLLRTGETLRPSPPPGAAPDEESARLAAATDYMERRAAKIPDFAALHLSDADGPDECHRLLAQTCGAVGFHNVWDVHEYFDGMIDNIGFDSTYVNYRKQLQALQWRMPSRRWALKYPNHVLIMDRIADIFPGSRFVLTHRDPVQVLASMCKVTRAFRGRYSDEVDPHHIGRQMRHFIRRHIDGIMAFHQSPQSALAVHIDYYRVVNSPDQVLEETYRDLDLTLPANVRTSIADWLAQNPKGKRGANPYALEEFGLRREEIAEEYSDYIRAFDIPSEAEATV
jgi:hypothetical protein